MSMAPGWYSDPFSAGYLRWWDGKAWSSATQVAPRTDAAPVPAAPMPAAPAAPPHPAPQVPQYGAPPPPPTPPWSGYQVYPPRLPGPTFPLATWGSRFAARLIDSIILAVVLVPLSFALLWPAINDVMNQIPAGATQIPPDVLSQFYSQVVGKGLLLTFVGALLQLAYEVPQLVRYGRTVGKRVAGIRVRPLAEDRRPSLGEAATRTGVIAGGWLVAGGFFMLLDDLWPLWDKPWQQALHDKAAKTVVVPK